MTEPLLVMGLVGVGAFVASVAESVLRLRGRKVRVRAGDKTFDIEVGAPNKETLLRLNEAVGKASGSGLWGTVSPEEGKRLNRYLHLRRGRKRPKKLRHARAK